MSGNPNPQLATGTLNLYLGLAASGNSKGYESVAVNLGLVSLRHTWRLFVENRISPFINIDMSKTVEKLCHHFQLIFQAPGSSDFSTIFSVVVDATVVVKSWQILEIHGTIVGDIYPNNFLDVKGDSYGESIALLK